MHIGWKLIGVHVLAVALGLGCGEQQNGETSPDGEFEDGIAAGKADGTAFSACELEAVVDLVNDPQTTVEVLQGLGVHTRAARNIIDYRDNIDDNNHFDSAQEVDDVSYVGPVAFQQLVDAVIDQCQGRGDQAEVIFSPQYYDDSHLAAVTEAIDAAHISLDIAMYSFSDGRILDAIERALARGVVVRIIYNSAIDHRGDPEGTMSGNLEEAGVEVRWINKIMHHKFVIIDGPQSSLDQALSAQLITGSANWSHSAGTRYDENTVFLQGNSEAVLRFQREFNHLWAHSRDFVWNEEIEHFDTMEIAEESILDDPAIDAIFTSDNFRVYESSRYGWTFSVNRGENAVSDYLVELIWSAEESIRIASGHLRSRPVAEALMERHAADPDLDIRVYLDNQEYLSASTHDSQQRELEQCLEEAGDSEAQQQDCLDTGFLFAYALHEAGIDVRFKYYCYRWHYSYAEQMHHKYLIIDGRILVSGSYNLSDNAEHNTMENMVIYDGQAFPTLVADFIDNFETLWVTGEEDGLYEQLLEEVNGTAPFSIVFEPMALDWQEVTDLKSAIRANCPEINSTEYRTDPQRHTMCYR